MLLPFVFLMHQDIVYATCLQIYLISSCQLKSFAIELYLIQLDPMSFLEHSFVVFVVPVLLLDFVDSVVAVVVVVVAIVIVVVVIVAAAAAAAAVADLDSIVVAHHFHRDFFLPKYLLLFQIVSTLVRDLLLI